MNSEATNAGLGRARVESFDYYDRHSPDVAILIDGGGTILYASRSVERIGGFSIDELEGTSAWELVHPDDLDYALGSLAEAEEFDGSHDPSQIRVLRRDGTYLNCEISAFTPSDGDMLAMSIRDISGRDALPERRTELEKMVLLTGGECAGASLDGLDALLEQLAGAIGSLVSAHEVLLTSLSPDQTMVDSWSWRRPSVEHLLTRPGSSEDLRATASAVSKPGRIWMQLQPQAMATVTQPVEVDGVLVGMLTIAWHHADARRFWDEGNGHLLEALARTLVMTTRRVQRERALTHQVLHDALTGLGNRTQLTLSLERQLAGDGVGLTVVYCDLDGFKQVNDELGHAAGDEVLQVVGERLRASVRENDVVCRVGGDEFVVLCPGASEQSAQRIGLRLEEGLCGPALLDSGLTVEIAASLGIVRVVSATAADGRAVDVLELADQSMYEAKAAPGHSTVHATLNLT